MIATHNIKVNGKWIAAGESYELNAPEKAPDLVEMAKEPEKAGEPKAAEAPKRTAARRKK